MSQHRTKPSLSLIGLPTDRHSSFLRGAARAPAQIRAALFSDGTNLTAEDGTDLTVDVQLLDCGDLELPSDRADTDLITAGIRDLAPDSSPIGLGGDHSVTLPIVRALAAREGPLQILHFDAHPDLYDSFDQDPYSHASPFARIMEEGLASRLVQVGIRTLNRHQREQAERFEVEIVEMRDFEVARVPVLDGPLYVSIDLDGLDPAYAPGVSHLEPGGLSVRDLIDVLHSQRARLVGADIVELNPDRDLNGMTAAVAGKLVKELCAYAATRRS